MQLRAVSFLYRRAILIYIGTIVVPVGIFVWLVFQSFEEQRQLLIARTQESIERLTKDRTEQEVARAFADPGHQIIEFSFTLKDDVVIDPQLIEPLPAPTPEAFDEIERQEARAPQRALAAYRALLAANIEPALALARIARCYERLGQRDEARASWRELARRYPDARDPSDRPYGIVAALAAGDQDGLYDEIVSGRWVLSAENASYFLEKLAPGRDSPYLERIRFGQTLSRAFRPPTSLVEGVIYQDVVDSRRIRFRRDGAAQIRGFSIDEGWVTSTLVPKVRQDLQADDSRSSLWVYGGSLSLVVTLLLVGVVMLVRDVSRETETNRSRAELVSSVSHELKTPITLVRLYSETLLRHRDFSEDDRLGFYRILARESTRLGRLIDQVLTFSRVDRGAQVYHFEEGDLASVVLGVVEDYREYLESAGFQLHCHVPETLPSVRFDGAALSQALVNLIDNAAKYSGTDRSITVAVIAHAATVVVEVADRGIGIAAAEQARIFERFYRVPNGTGKGGYGLGLFLVRHIAEAHGGRAEVESEPGRGSRFRLILPMAAPCPNPAS